MSNEKYQIVKLIGIGEFSEVYLVKDENSDYFAMKKMSKSLIIDRKMNQKVQEEISYLMECSTEESLLNWIINFKESYETNSHLFIIMEYLPGGDLFSHLNHAFELNGFGLNIDIAKLYIAEIAIAISKIHKSQRMHRDLFELLNSFNLILKKMLRKPSNILLDLNGSIKIIDFGFIKELSYNCSQTIETRNSSNKRKRPNQSFSKVGSPDYMAPEVISEDYYDESCDWWSLGVIAFGILILILLYLKIFYFVSLELIDGIPPFFSDSPSDTIMKVLSWENSLKFPEWFDPVAKDFIERLLCDSYSRMSFPEVKQHPFLQDINWKNLEVNLKDSKHEAMRLSIHVDGIEDTHYFDQNIEWLQSD